MTNSDLLADLMAVERQRSDALCRRDIAHLEACLDAKFVYVHGSGKIDDRADFIASHIARTAEFTSFVYEDETAIDHDHWSLLTGVITMNYTLNEASKALRYRFVSSWLKQNGTWQLCHWQNTAIGP